MGIGKRDVTGAARPDGPTRGAPGPIWMVVVLLGLEGVGNLFEIPGQPAAAVWLAAKILFVTGLIRGWAWVYILFLISAALHVLEFAAPAPFVAFVNLALMALVGSSHRHFFPRGDRGARAKSRVTGSFDPDFDA